jgi:anti-sigma B factor antagonist
MNFEIESERVDDGLYVISLGGEIDLYTAPELKQRLVDAVQAGARMIVIDLTETTFIDSTTLGVLVGAVKRLREKGGELSLVCRDQNIIKIFEITGLDHVFAIHASREKALAAAASGEASSS